MFNYTFHWNQALKALPQLLDGAVVTLQIAILSMVIGLACAIVLTLFRLSGNRILGAFASVWVEIARNTPALFQIYMAHFGLGNFGIHLSPYTALLVGIAFNNAGYLAENFRGALKAIPDTQTRSGRSLGMTSMQTFRLIILPQMLRVAFLPATNQMVWAILMTSLGVTVGMNTDLAGVTQALNARSFRTFEFFALAAVIYYVIAKIVTLAARLLAARLFRY
ncbi:MULTISPECIES: amino acid ABC transporter permease [Rhizobium/Agrobacterium group]|uniref:amino acid ABC transporter permease n=1 Tax=Rhizobium/Agrobacterium group TaxID=227290 RepID=UPI00107F38C5|nr:MULTISPECIES: amino acid ABC transporter permease [Rhizobium/Agrobacterium group]MBB4401187.1 polar amino acid transport system permease protein [Agrobacterium radiobacter]MBB5588206.1 polar amino acid transport system permease protein [Agrobacterium radiobacter]NTB99688.1 amino acid ABC transporter permease [Agrobacterium tumefaciens]NTC47465.1 amino acid ABC transporter permease [Agrobacterium tumefaciens]NTC47636.1 amino acid ABC transporter permease [Agrobacterium tumefaciens]